MSIHKLRNECIRSRKMMSSSSSSSSSAVSIPPNDITIANNSISDNTMNNNNNTQTLDLQDMDLTLLASSDLVQLANTVRNCTLVNAVDVSCPNNRQRETNQLQWNSDDNHNDVRHLFETLGCLPNLQKIQFKFLGGGDHDNCVPLSLFTALLRSHPNGSCPKLESFRLVLVGPIACTRRDMEEFAAALRLQKHLCDFRLSCCYFSHDVLDESSLSFTTIANNSDVSKCRENMMDPILQALSTLPLLDTVNLKAASKGHLGGIQAASLGDLLRQSTTLKTLCLDNFVLDNSHVKFISKALLESSSNGGGALEYLYLNLSGILNLDTTILPLAVQANQSLQRLQLRLSKQNGLETFLLNIAKALQSNTSLKDVGIFGGINVSDDVEKAFANMLECNCVLESLVLPSNYTAWRRKIDLFLQFNRQGRQRLLRESQSITRLEWLEMFADASNDIDFVYYYMRTISPLL